jgi:hypothetical protein
MASSNAGTPLTAQTGHGRSPHDAPELEKLVVRISRARISRRVGGLKKLAAILSSARARAVVPGNTIPWCTARSLCFCGLFGYDSFRGNV